MLLYKPQFKHIILFKIGLKSHTMWATQAQIDEDIQDEIQELKSHQTGWRSINRCTNTGDAKM